jgi:hypothetical protein
VEQVQPDRRQAGMGLLTPAYSAVGRLAPRYVLMMRRLRFDASTKSMVGQMHPSRTRVSAATPALRSLHWSRRWRRLTVSGELGDFGHWGQQ